MNKEIYGHITKIEKNCFYAVFTTDEGVQLGLKQKKKQLNLEQKKQLNLEQKKHIHVGWMLKLNFETKKLYFKLDDEWV